MNFYSLSTTRTLSKNDVTIKNDILTLEISDTTVTAIGTTNAVGTFNLAELVQKYSQDHGCIALFPKAMHIPDTQEFMAMETTQLSLSEKGGGDPGMIYQKTDVTPAAEGKTYPGSPWSVINSRYSSYGYLYILTPYKDCPTSELTIIFRDGANITVNGSAPSSTSIVSMHAFLESWLPIIVNGPSTIKAGDTHAYTVTAPANTTVYLSSDIGVINRSRVTNCGTFNLDTTGLNAGEVVTIKTGYKYWTGVSTKVVTLD